MQGLALCTLVKVMVWHEHAIDSSYSDDEDGMNWTLLRFFISLHFVIFCSFHYDVQLNTPCHLMLSFLSWFFRYLPHLAFKLMLRALGLLTQVPH